MRLKYFSKLKTKIRYVKENDHYALTINKRFLEESTMCFFLMIDVEFLKNKLINTFEANREKSRYGYPKYTFKTKAKAKKAVEWLRSIEVMNKLCE